MSADASASATRGAEPHPTPPGITVLSVAFPYAPIGPRAVGGAEVICSMLEAALPGLGFHSVVVAHAASEPAGQLYPTPVPEGTITDDLRLAVEAAQQRSIDRALAEHPVALVHMHGLDFHRYRIPAHIPVLVTLHLPPSWYPEAIWSVPPNYHLVCVSETERKSCPEHLREGIAVVGNGVPLPDPATLRPEGKYALMLSRICPEKNLHTGLDAACQAGMPALLAGECFPYEAHQRYFAEQIEPRLTSSGSAHQARCATSPQRPTARFLGPVCGEEKSRLIARAACLLLPSLALETSSLVAMEALAAGVPVIGMGVGAVPEIVESGRTGYLIDPAIAHGPGAVQALAEALSRLPTLDRSACRAAAESRFSLHSMLQGYGTLYRQLALTIPPKSSSSTIASPPASQSAPSSSPAVTLAATQALVVAQLTADAELEALAPEWTELWAADPTATPFQHPAWLLPWWHQFGSDGRLNALTLRHPETHRLLGFLPTYTYTPPDSDRPQLLLIGAGTSDYLGGLWQPLAHTADPLSPSSGSQATARLPQAALEQVASHLRCWSTASLNQLSPQSPLLEAARHLGLGTSSSEPCSTIDLSAPLPPRILANTGRYHRRAAAQGNLSCALAATSEEALESFDHLVRLHRERWSMRGEPGVLADARVLAHHREAVPLLQAAGLLRLFRLTLDGTTLGVLYGLADGPHADGRRLCLYLIGFDTRFGDLSPGTLLLHSAWQQARSEGFARLDLLRGGESYKSLWGAHPEPTFAINLQRG